ncbi:DUF1893 domain-containing protein [candidate division WOR-3 bacterium]|uniref:DUF1893 domain-containing protein n=1 Tax=candidate division WOR-3 bacterium TaxID=2052148 RepID=A0A937XI82_UNCW3|nr:DUF1893 domain-containing protein [candidate division WOR-3 bacterium]
MAAGDRTPTDPLTVLENDCLSLLVVRQGTELYRSYDDGVKPLLELIDWFPGGLEGATVADRVVGACAARIFYYLRVDHVIGLTGSIPAERILHAAAISYSFRTTVVDIMNRDNTGRCPFEQLSLIYPSPRDLIPAIRAKLVELRLRRQ